MNDKSGPDTAASVRWSIERTVATFTVVLSTLIGLAYAYSYNRIGLSPSVLGLSPGDLILDAAAGLGFLALFVFLPIGCLIALHVATLGTHDTRPRAARFGRDDLPLLGAVLAASVVLAWVLRALPASVLEVAIPVAIGASILGTLVAVTWSTPRLEEGLTRSCWRAVLDIAFAEYASLMSFAATWFLIASFLRSPRDRLVAIEMAAASAWLVVVLVSRTRRWSAQFRRGTYDPARLMGLRAPVASLLIVGFWLLLASYADTLHFASRLERHGEVSHSLVARLRSSSVTCVRLQWLTPDRPLIPEFALHVGDAGGTAVFYVPREGPLRVPSGQVALLPADDERCRVR